MPDELIRKSLERVLVPDTLLERNRPELLVFDQAADSDAEALREMQRPTTTQARALEIAQIICKRFGTIVSAPHELGHAKTLHTVVDPGIAGFKLRIKGINAPDYVAQNLQHALFLQSRKALGFTPIIGYGPNAEVPLYLVMVEGPKVGRSTLIAEEVTAGTPKTLKELIDCFGQYGVGQQRLGETDCIPTHLSLVRARLDDVISDGKLTDDNKQWLRLVVSKSTDYILKNAYTGKEPSTWVLSDAELDNLVSMVNAERSFWTFIDQGYYPRQIDLWRNIVGMPVAQHQQWFGRIEFNLGQFAYALLRSDKLPPQFIDAYGDIIATAVKDGQLKGAGKPRAMPEPHNPALSHCYFLLGVLSQQVIDIAYTGPSEAKIHGLAYLQELLRHPKPYALDKEDLGLGKQFD